MKTLIQFLAALILLPAMGVGALLLSSSLPGAPIHRHALMSMPVEVGGESSNDDLLSHAFTDAIMVNMATTNTEAKPLDYALCNLFYWPKDRENEGAQGVNLLHALQGKTHDLKLKSYARYWHGYLFMLRPLMSIMTYNEIRILNFIILNTLFILLIGFIWRRLGGKTALCFCMGLLIVTAPSVAARFQTTDIFAITYLACIGVLLTYNTYLKDLKAQIFYFYVIGCATSFFDFLTAPILTLGLPVLLLMLLYGEELHQKRLKAVIIMSVVWGFGYAWMWSSKWVLSELFTDYSLIEELKNQICVRTIGNGDIGDLCLNFNIYKVFIYACGGAAVVAHLILSVKKMSVLRSELWLILIMMMPVLWTLVLLEHTILHKGMTWRIYSVSIIAWAVFLMRNSSLQVLMQRLRLIRRSTEDRLAN